MAVMAFYLYDDCVYDMVTRELRKITWSCSLCKPTNSCYDTMAELFASCFLCHSSTKVHMSRLCRVFSLDGFQLGFRLEGSL